MRRSKKQKEYAKYLKSKHWLETKEIILERDNHECLLCESKKYLHVHHHTYENLGNEKSNDLMTLCGDCHLTYHLTDIYNMVINEEDPTEEDNKNMMNYIKEKSHEFETIKQLIELNNFIDHITLMNFIDSINNYTFNSMWFMRCCLKYLNIVAISKWDNYYAEKYNFPIYENKVIYVPLDFCIHENLHYLNNEDILSGKDGKRLKKILSIIRDKS